MEGTIREIRPGDRDEWLRMRNALLPSEDHDAETRDYFSGEPEFAVFVFARADGALGGFIEVGLRAYAEGCATSPVAYIEAWYVDDDLRRKGVGAALVRTAEGWARERGLHEIASDALIENERSIAAHLALGYEEIERIVCFRKAVPARDAVDRQA